MSDQEKMPNPYQPPETEDPLREAMEYRDNFEDDAEFQEALSLWPVCPECGKRRITRCPICKVAGNLFPLADSEFWFEIQESAQTQKTECSTGHSCCQGDGGCQSGSSRPPVPGLQLSQDLLPSNIDLGRYMPAEIAKQAANSATADSSTTDTAAANSAAEPVLEKEAGDNGQPASLLTNQLGPGVPDPRQPAFYLVQDGFNAAPVPTIISVTSDSVAKEMLESFSLEEQLRKSEAGLTRQRELKLVVCHVCSEPFEPKFPHRCEWCGHVFEEDPEGEEAAVTGKESLSSELNDSESEKDDWVQTGIRPEEDNNRVIFATFFVLIVLFCLAMGYLWFLFREPSSKNTLSAASSAVPAAASTSSASETSIPSGQKETASNK